MHTKELSDKKNSIKTETNATEPKNKRERQIKSPPNVKSEYDEAMNSFSSRTNEESFSAKQPLTDSKFDGDSNPNKFYKMQFNAVTMNSNKQIKHAFKTYNKNDNIIAQKYKNLSNEGEKSESSKKRNSISGNSSVLNTSSKNVNKVTKPERSKMRSISSASSIKTFQTTQKKTWSNEAPQKIDETLSEIYSSIEENSVCNKRHDISVVEADGILDQINSRMMKFHFEMIYKNLDMQGAQDDDFSFEIDNTNNMIVPKNSSDPIKDKKFVQLPHREDLYHENELSNGNIQWKADINTIRIFPKSPIRNQNASTSSPFTSPQTNPCSPGVLLSPKSGRRGSSSKYSVKQSMYSFQRSSNHYYEQNNIIKEQKQKQTLSKQVEIKDHEDNEKDINDDIEIERELEYSQNFIPIHDPNSSQVEKSFESRFSEGTESVNTNNFSFISGMSQFVKNGKESRFMNFVREKIHVIDEENIQLYPSLNMQSHLKLYKPSFFAIAYQLPAGPELEHFKFFKSLQM
jgi:hypothetical protein